MAFTEALRQIKEVQFPPDLLANWRSLRQRAIETAEFHPNISDYIVLRWANKDGYIDTVAEAQAAKIISHIFRLTNPTHVLAIQNSGISLGHAVHAHFPQTEFIQAVKYETEPDPNIESTSIIIQACSYSRQENMWFEIPIFPDDSRVLVVDDVCAHGNVGYAVCDSIGDNKVVGFGVYFDKAFQDGLGKISSGLNIPCFSVIRIAGIESGTIVLMEEEQSLTSSI